ncbi:unnamed protein product [Caenorhabditis bovis]|uniref:Triacylglycerol lipase n=1 Tax=Caenorhabditis bovis TaxID=2654633 RepID=A0A8S1FD90_9PELO|nr:unnamed protein product [Caenorhabditis bovis]
MSVGGFSLGGMRTAIVLVIASAFAVLADFSDSFNEFVVENYGQEMNELLARRDLGDAGSFGGGAHNGTSSTSKQAVILVHGITNTAGTFRGHRNHLLNIGWSDETVYATTYGDGGQTWLPFVDMKCEYVKQVRYLIEVVANFTKNKVDVIGYSLGSPIARKAILGGKCVDTNDELGPPLTHLIETYLSVAGANRGSIFCGIPFPGACSATNGLYCRSKFIKDINAQHRYEGEYIFGMIGRNDDKVGYLNACAQKASTIDEADAEYEMAGNHDDVIFNEAQMQFNLIDLHTP